MQSQVSVAALFFWPRLFLDDLLELHHGRPGLSIRTPPRQSQLHSIHRMRRRRPRKQMHRFGAVVAAFSAKPTFLDLAVVEPGGMRLVYVRDIRGMAREPKDPLDANREKESGA